MSEALRIAIAGLGTVGCGTVKLLQENKALLEARAGRAMEIVAVSARSEKDRGLDLKGIRYESDARNFATAADVDVVVELIGGDEGIARTLVEQSLANGKHVITANKALIAKHGAAIANASEENSLALGFEAAVAGGTPILGVLRKGLVANKIRRVSGILNGTCNFILTEMEKHGREYEDMLAEAESLGYLEADPRLDIDGIDTAHKLAILAALSFGTAPNMDAVDCEGIGHVTLQDVRYAANLGYRIKLLGVAEHYEDGSVAQYVAPMLVSHSSPLASVDSSYNAIEVHGDHVERVFITGRGAGPGPTASAVVADIVSAARDVRHAPFSVPAAELKPIVPASLSTIIDSYYLRVRVKDQPGVLAKIAELCSTHGVSVEELHQHAHEAEGAADIIMTTHEASWGAIQETARAIEALETSLTKPLTLRLVEA